MRFDDRLSTVLAVHPTDARGKAAVWTQLVDLLAQNRDGFPEIQRAASLERLSAWRADVAENRRVASSVSIANHALPLELVRFFAVDTPAVAAPILARAHLSSGDWQALLPLLPPASRAILRKRQDLPPETMRALNSLGTTDFALIDAHVRDVKDDSSVVENELLLTEIVAERPTSINELVERIDSWRSRRSLARTTKPAQRPISDFAFECGIDGVITWVEGAPRGALIGINLSTMAEFGECGVEGQAVGAFRKRLEIREAPLRVAGETSVSGEWLLFADPRFEPETGRFLGYLGIARRPKHYHPGSDESEIPSGSIRQLVHELRTPLNAIRGFGEMIEGQFLGPVAAGYRHRARAIVHDSGALLNVFEDLDANARLETGDYPIAPDARVDMTEVVRAVAMLHADLVDERGIRLRIALPAREGLKTALDRASALRMVDRLLGATLSTTTPGDQVELSLQVEPGQLVLAVSNVVPAVREDDMDGFAPLGRDFALRLAARLAERAGGRLEQAPGSFRLIVPAMEDSARANGSMVDL